MDVSLLVLVDSQTYSFFLETIHCSDLRTLAL